MWQQAKRSRICNQYFRMECLYSKYSYTQNYNGVQNFGHKLKHHVTRLDFMTVFTMVMNQVTIVVKRSMCLSKSSTFNKWYFCHFLWKNRKNNCKLWSRLQGATTGHKFEPIAKYPKCDYMTTDICVYVAVKLSKQ